MNWLADIISAIAAFLRLKEKADDRRNAPEIRANERAKQNAEIRDTATNAVKTDDLEKIRRMAAE